ncbi:MAG: hypothetical protein DMD57_00020 [Gemmatimonadetes bacterium]|nr:MAG: hypothetical protein DMD57_00020 [Gemmatimonadota bacterium]
MTNDGPCPRGARVQADGESRWLRRTVASATAVGGILLLASCNERPLPSPGPASGVNAQAVSGGPFTFENFELGAATGTVCPGSSACTNGAAEPAIRADATGTFYVSSELGLASGTLAWKSTDGGLHYTALESPNQISQAFGGVGPGGGDTDLSTAPDANASGIHNVYVASLSLANVTVSTSQDGGQTWSQNVTSATIPIDDREWIAADQASKVCISYHDIVTFNIDVNCSFDAGASFTQLGSAIDLAHAFLIDDNEIGNLTIDPNSHVVYQVFSGIATVTEALLPSSFHAVWIAVSRDGGKTFTDKPVYVNPNTSVSYGHQFVNVSVDRAGTVYVVYTDNHNLFYSFSTDGGDTWSGPIQVNQAPSATATTIQRLRRGTCSSPRTSTPPRPAARSRRPRPPRSSTTVECARAGWVAPATGTCTTTSASPSTPRPAWLPSPTATISPGTSEGTTTPPSRRRRRVPRSVRAPDRKGTTIG